MILNEEKCDLNKRKSVRERKSSSKEHDVFGIHSIGYINMEKQNSKIASQNQPKRMSISNLSACKQFVIIFRYQISIKVLYTATCVCIGKSSSVQKCMSVCVCVGAHNNLMFKFSFFNKNKTYTLSNTYTPTTVNREKVKNWRGAHRLHVLQNVKLMSTIRRFHFRLSSRSLILLLSFFLSCTACCLIVYDFKFTWGVSYIFTTRNRSKSKWFKKTF